MITSAQRIAGLSPEKHELLRRRLARSSGLATGPRREPAPLPRAEVSFAQRRLWFLDQLVPGNTAYNIVEGVRLHGPADRPYRIDVLRQCLRELVRRHDVLRTTFVVEDGEPRQQIAPALDPPFTVVDLRDLEPEAREAEARLLVSREAETPFELEHGPLLRVHVVQLQDHELVFVLAIHHIIFDGWSMEVLIGEMAALYGAFATGAPSPLPALPIQYADYARWQRGQLAGPRFDALVRYWRDRLGEDLPVLELPLDHERVANGPRRSANESFRLPPELSAALVAFARRHNVTMFMLLLAGFLALLGRYSGQDRIAVGTPIAGRTDLELEKLIGLFVNTLVLCGDLSGDPTFFEHLERVRETALGAFAHQQMPLEKLVEELRPERRLGHSPLFQVMFSVQSGQSTAAAATGAGDAHYRGEQVHATQRAARFDLGLGMEDKQGWCGSFEYDTALFEASTIRRMIGELETLLRAAVEAPERRISELPLSGVPHRPVAIQRPLPRRPREILQPRDEIELRLARLWEEVLGHPVGALDNFFELGGHSFQAITLMAAIQRELGRRLPVATLFQHQTLEQLAAAIRQDPRDRAWSCLVPIQPARRAGSHAPLFCVHPIGGNVFCYSELARSLAAEQPVVGLQAYGLGAGAAPDRDVRVMAARYLEEVRSVQPIGPYRLAGWSFGGVVAFEMACQLEAAGHEVERVLAFDSWAGARHAASPGAQHVRWFLDDLVGGRRDVLHTEPAPDATIEEQLQHGLAQAREAHLVPPRTELATIVRLFEVFQANLDALHHYTPARFGGPLTLFKARNNPAGALDPDHGWRPLVGELTVCPVPGDHYSLLQPRHVHHLAEELTRILDHQLRPVCS